MARVQLPKSTAPRPGHMQELRQCRRGDGASPHLRKDHMPGKPKVVQFAPIGGEVGHHPWCLRVTAAEIPRGGKDLAAAHPTDIALRYLKQELGDTLQEYIRRFRRVEGRTHGLPVASVIPTFYLNARSARVRKTMAAHWVHAVAELYALAYRSARAEEASRLRGVGRRWLAVSRPGTMLPRALMGPEPFGGALELKNSFVIKIGRARDGSHTDDVDLDLAGA